MKKLINKYTIFTFIMGLLISGIGVYAYTYIASDIPFTPKSDDWQVTNVDDAINDLYDNSITNNITSNTNYYMGNRYKNPSRDITLEKGKYVVFVASSYNSSHTVVDATTYKDTNLMTLSSEDCTKLTEKEYFYSATQKIGGFYVRMFSYDSAWYCNLQENTTLTAVNNTNHALADEYPMQFRLYAVKIH